MLFGLIETKAEKENRFLKLDIQNNIKRKQCEKENIPCFTSRYIDDFRMEGGI